MIDLDIRRVIGQEESLYSLTTLTESVRYIPLETNDSCLLYGIQKIYFTSEKIFVADRMGLYQFDMSGKFKRRIGRPGKGPGEHGTSIIFDVSAINGEIYILSSGIMNVYSLESGSFKRSFPVNHYVSNFAATSNGKLIFFTYELSPGPLMFTIYEAYIATSDGILIDSIANFNRLNNLSMIAGYVNLFKTSESEFQYMYNFNDTLYILSENFSRKPHIVYNLDNSIRREKLFIEPGVEIQIPDFIWLPRILGNSKYLFITIQKGIAGAGSDKRDIIYAIYNYEESDLSITTGFSNNIDGGKTFWPKFSIEDKLIDWHFPYEIIGHYHATKGTVDHSKDFLTLVNSLDENDNPVLVIVE